MFMAWTVLEETCLLNDALALFDKNTLYVGDDILGDIIGTGDRGLVNGFQNEAQFNRPRNVAILGHSIFVADSGNNAIRHVRVNDNGRNYFVSTVIEELDSSPLSVTTMKLATFTFCYAMEYTAFR